MIDEDGTQIDTTWRRLFRAEWQSCHIPVRKLRMLRLSLALAHIWESYPGLVSYTDVSHILALFNAGLLVGFGKWRKMERRKLNTVVCYKSVRSVITVE